MATSRPLAERIIAFAKLDLGRKPYSPGDFCGPALAGSVAPKVYYPTIWIDGQAKPIDLPKSGKAMVQYKVVSRSSNERDGVTKHDASLEIQSIEPCEEKKKTDAARPVKFSALQPGMITFDRARNTDGEFAPQAEGAPDPATMRAAYGHQSGAVKTAVGATAGLGGTAAAALLLARKLKARRG